MRIYAYASLIKGFYSFSFYLATYRGLTESREVFVNSIHRYLLYLVSSCCSKCNAVKYLNAESGIFSR